MGSRRGGRVGGLGGFWGLVEVFRGYDVVEFVLSVFGRGFYLG